MRAIIWKEIRENLKWAVLAMLAVALVMASSLWQMASSYMWNRSDISLLNNGFPVLTLMVTAVFGAFLGFMQVLPERRRDQWAYLIHRPVTATQIFWGKVIAGLLLYVLAMLLPLLGSAIWCAVPGHIGTPFSWQEILPGIADILSGMAFYFAAMLISGREARWYASRCLPFIPAILCIAVVNQVPEFWQALLFGLLSIIVLATAAWGSFIASGQYRSQPGRAKPALGLILLAGIVTIGMIAAIVIEEGLRGRNREVYTTYAMDVRGRVLRMDTQNYYDTVNNVVDLEGNPIDEYNGKPLNKMDDESLLYFLYLQMPSSDSEYSRPKYGDSDRYFLRIDDSGDTVWYFVPTERLIAGYSRRTLQHVGSVGPAGFTPPGIPPRELFPHEPLVSFPRVYSSMKLIAFPSAAYAFDPSARQVRLLVAGTKDNPILAADARDPDLKKTYPTGIAGVLTAKRIYIFRDLSQPGVSVPYHYPPKEFPYISVATMPEGGYAIHYNAGAPVESDHLPAWKRTCRYVLVAADGTELKRYDPPPLVRREDIPSWPHILWALIVPPIGMVALPAWIYVWTWMLDGSAKALTELHNNLQQLQGMVHVPFYIAWVAVLVGGAVAWAIAVYLYTRRYSPSTRQSWGWFMAGLLLGPAGLLLLLCLRDWPVLVACAWCGKSRPVDLERCPHCATAFPPPLSGDTDIFDDLACSEKVPVHG